MMAWVGLRCFRYCIALGLVRMSVVCFSNRVCPLWFSVSWSWFGVRGVVGMYSGWGVRVSGIFCCPGVP